MKRVIGIIAILVIAALAFVYPSIAENNSNHLVEDNVTALALNDSDFNISTLEESQPEIKMAKDYKEVQVKKTDDGIVSKEDMKAFYENYYNSMLIFDDDSKADSVDVSDIKTLSNGSKYYRITIKNNKHNSLSVFDALADVIPKDIASQNPKIRGVFHSFYCDYKDDDDISSILKTEEQILEKAESKYQGHYKSPSNGEVHVYSNNINGNTYYMVDFENSDLLLVYDDNYLYFDSYTDNENYGSNEYLEMSKEAAMEKLRSQNYDYMDKLSLDEGSEITDPVTYQYNFTVTYTDDNGSQTLGYIIVDAYTREIIEFNVAEPVMDNTTNDTTNTTDDAVDVDVGDVSEDDNVVEE